MKESKKYDVIIIGSGPGGSTVARELARRGKKVLVLEAGPEVQKQKLGNFWDTVILPGRWYDNYAAFSMSLQGTTIYNTRNTGGTSVVACGNYVRSSQKDFQLHGIDLETDFQEAESELSVKPLADNKIVFGSRVIMQTAQKMGLQMGPMPKAGNYTFCDACGDCVLGCHLGAKWDARVYLNEAQLSGAELMTRTKVDRVRINASGDVLGVETNKGFIEGNLVVVAAGGLNTPVILQKSDIGAGRGLFIDPFNATYGVVDYTTQVKGASMAAVDVEYHQKGFLLSPYMDHWSQTSLFLPWWYIFHGFPQKRILGIMCKITDERSGRVYKNGLISKRLTRQDQDRLRAGSELAKSILVKAGARDVVVTKHPRGAHPGGTAAVGEVVDGDLRVKGCKGLYVCDASVFPVTPGLPPILTIVALGKWLAKRI